MHAWICACRVLTHPQTPCCQTGYVLYGLVGSQLGDVDKLTVIPGVRPGLSDQVARVSVRQRFCVAACASAAAPASRAPLTGCLHPVVCPVQSPPQSVPVSEFVEDYFGFEYSFIVSPCCFNGGVGVVCVCGVWGGGVAMSASETACPPFDRCPTNQPPSLPILLHPCRATACSSCAPSSFSCAWWRCWL